MDLHSELTALTDPVTGVLRGLRRGDTLVRVEPSELRRIHAALVRARLFCSEIHAKVDLTP
jgi:hypothetical protein